ncbi:MAG: thymidine phosphorylase family protein [Gemmatimonadota bacterium]
MSGAVQQHAANVLRLRRIGIDTYQEPIIFMSAECPVCKSEGWEALARVRVAHGNHSIIATLNVVTSGLLAPDEAALSDAAWRALGAAEGDTVTLSHTEPVSSLGSVRAKVYGQRLDAAAFSAIMRDIVAGRYSSIHLSAFVTACAGGRLDMDETIALTRAMIDVGDRLSWPQQRVVDKHSVGGLPGNRTTIIVVPIVAAYGLTMPKTSSRAITSPAGTADAMETVAPVTLDIPAMRRVVEREGACIVWGGAVRLSPADDMIIRIEGPLDIDSEGQLVASVLSKKAAAGSTHVVIDLPIGATAKVRNAEAAATLGARLAATGRALGLRIEVVEGDGTQPIGRGIGPALEARDVLAVLQGQADAPADLRERALVLAGRVIELGDDLGTGNGYDLARGLLDSGAAWLKFRAICDAQGGIREPPQAQYTHEVSAPNAGRITTIDNRRLARLAKLAGAPRAKAAGLQLHVRLGTRLEHGEPLYTLHAESPGELAYALAYAEQNPGIIGTADGSA